MTLRTAREQIARIIYRDWGAVELGKWDKRHTYDRDLYLETADEILAALRAIPELLDPHLMERP